jgi:hypothetical protein
MRIAATGAFGCSGRHITKRLLNDGRHPSADIFPFLSKQVLISYWRSWDVDILCRPGKSRSE